MKWVFILHKIEAKLIFIQIFHSFSLVGLIVNVRFEKNTAIDMCISLINAKYFNIFWQ